MNKEERLNKITKTIIGVAINIHRSSGPGLLESAYEACMIYDPTQAGLKVEQQKPLPVVYRGVKLECGYRLDLMVENVEILKDGIQRVVNNFPDSLRSQRSRR